jgi:hypothetical protein
MKRQSKKKQVNNKLFLDSTTDAEITFLDSAKKALIQQATAIDNRRSQLIEEKFKVPLQESFLGKYFFDSDNNEKCAEAGKYIRVDALMIDYTGVHYMDNSVIGWFKCSIFHISPYVEYDGINPDGFIHHMGVSFDPAASFNTNNFGYMEEIRVDEYNKDWNTVISIINAMA